MPRRLALAAVLLALATAAAFSPALLNGFVPFDDDRFITAEPHVATGLGAANFLWALTSADQCNWQPLSRVLYQLLATPAGPRPLPYHAAGIALHAAAAALCFLLLARATGRTGAAALAAGFFALHPLRVESVVWAAELKDALAAALFFAAAGAWLAHRRRPSPGRLSAAVALQALGIAAKPTLVVLPAALLALDYWPLGRIRSARELLARVAEKWPFLALSAAGSVVAARAQAACGGVTNERYPLAARLGNAADAVAAYLRTTVWPAGLAFFYPHPGRLGPARVALAAALVVGIAAAAWLLRRRLPWLLSGWLWFLAALLPVSGLVQLGEQARADRFTYLPAAGLAMALAWCAAAASRRLPRPALAAAAACLLGGLAALSAAQARTWRDGESLYRHAVAVTRGNWLAESRLGALLLERGQVREAAPLVEDAYRLAPDYLDAVRALGDLRRLQGRASDAYVLHWRILSELPGDAAARHALGADLEALGKPADALREYEHAARLDPGSAAARTDVGRLMIAQGRRDAGCFWLGEALRVAPGFPEAQRLQRDACR